MSEPAQITNLQAESFTFARSRNEPSQLLPSKMYSSPFFRLPATVVPTSMHLFNGSCKSSM